MVCYKFFKVLYRNTYHGKNECWREINLNEKFFCNKLIRKQAFFAINGQFGANFWDYHIKDMKVNRNS